MAESIMVSNATVEVKLTHAATVERVSCRVATNAQAMRLAVMQALADLAPMEPHAVLL
jgi:hypothetical protein